MVIAALAVPLGGGRRRNQDPSKEAEAEEGGERKEEHRGEGIVSASLEEIEERAEEFAVVI